MTFKLGGWCPDLPQNKTVEPRLQMAQFGDGYAQAVADGINPIGTKWAAAFSYRTKAEIMAIEAYLRANIGKLIPMYDYADATEYSVRFGKWQVEWSNGPSNALRGKLSIEFTRAYGVFP